MKNNTIETSRIRVATVRYFDAKRRASAVPNILAYVFLVNVNGVYINIFNPLEEYPVYDRLPYSNTTRDGEDFGTKLTLVNGEIKDGPCYIMDRIDIKRFFGKDFVSVEEIKEYVIKSNNYFVDRIDLLKEHKGFIRGVNKRKIIMEDSLKKDELDEYFNSCIKEIQYKKN